MQSKERLDIHAEILRFIREVQPFREAVEEALNTVNTEVFHRICVDPPLTSAEVSRKTGERPDTVSRAIQRISGVLQNVSIRMGATHPICVAAKLDQKQIGVVFHCGTIPLNAVKDILAGLRTSVKVQAEPDITLCGASNSTCPVPGMHDDQPVAEVPRTGVPNGTAQEGQPRSRGGADLDRGPTNETLTAPTPAQVKSELTDTVDREASGGFSRSPILERLGVPTTVEDAQELLLRLFDKASRETIRRAIDARDVPICACLSVAPRGSQEVGAKVFYHLGHFYFVLLFELIRCVYPKTALLMCPSRRYVRDHGRDFNHRMIETICTWMRCFRYVPEVHSVYRIIESEKDDKRLDDLHNWLNKTALKCDNELNDEEKERISEWRGNPEVLHGSDLVSRLHTMFGQKVVSKATADQIMSIAYVLVKRPGWYDPMWFAKSVKGFACSRGTSVQKRVLGTNDIVIVEAIKNRTAWEPLAVCAKAFYCSEFPSRAYFKNLPNAYGNGPMRSKDDGVIPITWTVEDVLRKYDMDHLRKILRVFPAAVTRGALRGDDAIRHALSELLSVAYEALYLECASKKGEYSWERKSS